MSRIIALRGRADSGKTTTLKLLPGILLRNGYSNVIGTRKSYGEDFLEIFEKGGSKVGVTSSGDTFDLVMARLSDLVKAGCDVCICACRTYDRKKGRGTNAATQSFPGYSVSYVSKNYAQHALQEQAINATDAHTVFSKI